jgi:hypothetical protein
MKRIVLKVVFKSIIKGKRGAMPLIYEIIGLDPSLFGRITAAVHSSIFRAADYDLSVNLPTGTDTSMFSALFFIFIFVINFFCFCFECSMSVAYIL